MNDTATPPAAPWSDPPGRASQSDGAGAIPPLTPSERLVAEEPHGLHTCQVCGESFRWELYAAHLEDEHARGAGFVVRPPARPVLTEVRDVMVGLALLALDRVRRFRR